MGDRLWVMGNGGRRMGMMYRGGDFEWKGWVNKFLNIYLYKMLNFI